MSKIILVVSISLIMGVGLFLSVFNNNKTIDLARNNIEAVSVAAASADCIGEVDAGCREGSTYKNGYLTIFE